MEKFQTVDWEVELQLALCSSRAVHGFWWRTWGDGREQDRQVTWRPSGSKLEQDGRKAGWNREGGAPVLPGQDPPRP